MPVNQFKYHPEWKDRISPEVKRRANYHCQFCGVRDRALVTPMPDGTLFTHDDFSLKNTVQTGERVCRVILTTAHLNHLVIDNRWENLKSLCQWCHLHHDKAHKAKMKRLSKITDPHELIEISKQPGQEHSLILLFSVGQAWNRKQQHAHKIWKSRSQYAGKSSYDQEVRKYYDECRQTYEALVKRIVEILIDHYGPQYPSIYFDNYIYQDRLIPSAQNPT